MHPISRRTIGVASALLLASCFGDSTGPKALRRVPLAVAPVFDVHGASAVAFDKVRVTVADPQTDAPVVDTVADFPSSRDSISLTISVPVQGASQTFSLTLVFFTSAGDTVFRGGPVSVTVMPGVLNTAPATIPMEYVGVGSNAAWVSFSTIAAPVFFGDTAVFVAAAYDSTEQVIPGTPVLYRVDARDSALAYVPDPYVGKVVARSVRGTARVVAELLTPLADTTTLLIQPRPSAIVLQSGGGQTAPVTTTLAQPVTVRVNGSDGVGIAGLTVGFAATTGGGSASPASAVTDASGLASTTWTLGTVAGTQTLTASVGSVSSAPIAAAATAGAVSRLGFTVQPTTATAGVPMAAVHVAGQDVYGNLVTSFTGAVSLFLSTNPYDATLYGTLNATAVGGVASFGNLMLTQAGTGYALSASASGLTSATSAAFTVVAGAARTLSVYSGDGQTGAPNAPLAQPVVVMVSDSLGNGVSGRTVTFAVTSGGGSVGTASVTTNAQGLASTTWTLGAQASQSLTVTAAGLQGSPLTVTATAMIGAAYQLAFLVQPSTAVAGAPIAPAVQVAVQDSNGITVPTFADTVAVALASNPDTAVLYGTPIVTAVAGVATFSDLRMSKSGSGFTLLAASPRQLQPAISNAFTVAAGAAQSLVLLSGGSQSATPGSLLPQPVVVKVADSLGNGVSGRSVTFAVASGGGSVGTPNATTDAQGRASTTWTLGTATGQQTVTATSAGLAGSPLTITANGSGAASTVVTPGRDTLTALTATSTLSAQAKDSLGNNVGGSFTWASRNAAIATVSTAGVVTAVANGSTWVVATESGGSKDSAQIVVQQRVATVNLTPPGRNIYLTRWYTFTAAAVDGKGFPLPGTPTFTWSSSAPAVASVDGTGLVTGLGLGSTQIRATTSGVTGVANVNIITPITRIAVVVDTVGSATTDTFTLTSLGTTRRYRAIAHDTLDAVMSGVSFTWVSTNGSVAQLRSFIGDTVTALSAANGVTQIQATAQGFTSSPGALLTVSQVLASIELTPDSANPQATITVGGTLHVSARGKDANGRYIAGGTFTFHSSDTTIATVDPATGVVTGIFASAVAASTSDITATSGAVTSNVVTVTVGLSAPLIISFGRDTVSVGRGSSASIPILLSSPVPVGGPSLTVNLGASPAAYAHWSTASVTIPVGLSTTNATLVGDSAGTTTVTASDGSALGYASGSAVAKVTANMQLASSSYAINATDVVTTQVKLSDPSPAGGTYVTFSYGTAGIAKVSPDPAYIPAGQLAADIQILGLAGGSTTITPQAIGVNGGVATFTAYPPVLTPSTSQVVLGQGQYEPNEYVYLPAYTNVAVPVTITSADSAVASASPSVVMVPASQYYSYYTVTGRQLGVTALTYASPGWSQAYGTSVRVSTPRLGVCCSNGSLVLTSPQQNLTVYTEDSLYSAHYRTNALVVRLHSTDSTVIRMVDTTITVQPGQYYNSAGRFVMGGQAGSAWIVASASGHAPDSAQYTVAGPALSLSWGAGRPLLGAGQYEQNRYVYAPTNVAAALVVTLSSSDPTVASVPATVTIPQGSYYAYFTVTGANPGDVSIQATATGYQPVSGAYRVTSPALTACCTATLNNFAAGNALTVYSADTVRTGHSRTTPLAVSILSTDTAIVRVDSSSVTIPAGQSYSNTARVIPVGVGTARVIVTAPGHQTLDTLTYTVVTPKIQFSFTTLTLGRRQHFSPSYQGFYVYTPDNRTSPLAVTITRKQGAVDTLTTAAPTIPTGTYYAYLDAFGLATGVDTLIVSAPGYLPDTAFIRVTTPRLAAGGLPSTTTTTNPPIGVTVYATDSTGSSRYVMDTLVVAAASSDPTVVQPAQPSFRILPNSYYQSTTVAVVGPGSAAVTYSDSAGTGYQPVTTNSVTVTGPALAISNSAPMLGMRQTDGQFSAYVYVPNNVASDLPVHLASTDPRVVQVPDTVTIPSGSYYAYFPITALDTVGTIQVQATANGYGGAATTVQVTAPKFVVSASTYVYTTGGPQYLAVYAADANGNTHSTAEDVAVTLLSSSPSVASIDSSTVTIPAGSYYTQAATWSPGQVGTAQFSASDQRAAYYKYGTGTVDVQVATPPVYLYGVPSALGIGQYQDYVEPYTPDYMAAATTVQLSHVGTARTETDSNLTNIPISQVTIPQGSYYQYFRLAGVSAGTDSLVTSIASPVHLPDTAFVLVGPGRVDPLGSWPASLVAGDSVLVTLSARDPQQSIHNVVAATQFSFTSVANIQFWSGGANSVQITSVTIPADASSVQFYLKGVTAGTGSVTITSPNYQTYIQTVPVTP